MEYKPSILSLCSHLEIGFARTVLVSSSSLVRFSFCYSDAAAAVKNQLGPFGQGRIASRLFCSNHEDD